MREQIRIVLAAIAKRPNIRLGLAAGVAALLLLFRLNFSSPAALATALLSGTMRQANVGVPAPIGLHVVDNHIVDKAGNAVHIYGVSQSGTEYMCPHGDKIFDGPTDAASLAAITAWHVNTVRIPLNEDCWLGINGVSASNGGDAYRQAIGSYVSAIHRAGMYTILDLHFNAPGSTLATSQQVMADADHSPAFWASVAGAFKDDGNTILELYNEPHDISWACWRDGGGPSSGPCEGTPFAVAGMQTLVDAVRDAGATNLILLGGLSWSNDLTEWSTYAPRDRENNLAAAWHIYGHGSVASACATISCFDAQVAPLAARVPIVATETGEGDCAGSFVSPLYDWMDAHSVNYLAWAWNAGLDCAKFPSLIFDWLGTPTGYGLAFHDHLAALFGGAVPPAAPTALPVVTPAPPATSTSVGTPAGETATASPVASAQPPTASSTAGGPTATPPSSSTLGEASAVGTPTAPSVTGTATSSATIEPTTTPTVLAATATSTSRSAATDVSTIAPPRTSTPTASPTAVPTGTSVPTASPTAVPTRTSVPTASPTAVPTRTSVPFGNAPVAEATAGISESGLAITSNFNPGSPSVPTGNGTVGVTTLHPNALDAGSKAIIAMDAYETISRTVVESGVAHQETSSVTLSRQAWTVRADAQGAVAVALPAHFTPRPGGMVIIATSVRTGSQSYAASTWFPVPTIGPCGAPQGSMASIDWPAHLSLRGSSPISLRAYTLPGACVALSVHIVTSGRVITPATVLGYTSVTARADGRGIVTLSAMPQAGTSWPRGDVVLTAHLRRATGDLLIGHDYAATSQDEARFPVSWTNTRSAPSLAGHSIRPIPSSYRVSAPAR